MKKYSILALLFLGTLLMATAATAESKDKWSGLCDGDLSLPRRTAVSASPTTTSAQTPTYNELSATAHSALSKQDYIGAHKAFHTMDSIYGISDFEALYYYYSLSHDFVPDSEAEKALLFRLARNKCCDMRYLDDWAKRQQADTLDYWNDIVAIVAPRGYQDTVYQNR
ncbi:MAG: hypothetical protein II532_04820, partial [Bacteroidales bacterium]|nr:hypothetical protein [Bacteroidales bacterium]